MINQKNQSKKKGFKNIKKIEVSSMPGKTKVVQTIFLHDYQMKLLDCPGLVFPSILENYEDMYLFGILNVNNSKNLINIFSRIID